MCNAFVLCKLALLNVPDPVYNDSLMSFFEDHTHHARYKQQTMEKLLQLPSSFLLALYKGQPLVSEIWPFEICPVSSVVDVSASFMLEFKTDND